MPKTNFQTTKTLLKSHPNARPVAPRGQGRAPQIDWDAPPPDPERHSRKCRICNHPDRADIEGDFLRWRPTAEIAREFGLPDHSSICRHARALGLYDRRGESICFALDPILEQADRVFSRLTPNSLISAVQTYAQINNKGKRVRPVVHHHNINVTSAEYQKLLASMPHAEAHTAKRPRGAQARRAKRPWRAEAPGARAGRHRPEGRDAIRG
jgi:hypothetical protein